MEAAFYIFPIGEFYWAQRFYFRVDILLLNFCLLAENLTRYLFDSQKFIIVSHAHYDQNSDR